MEDFTEISTVQDLLKFNEIDEVEAHHNAKSKEILTTIYEEDPQVGLKIARDVLAQLESWHESVAQEMQEKGASTLVWLVDAAKLQAALNSIEDIAL